MMVVTKPISLNVPKALTISFLTLVSYSNPTLPSGIFAVAVKAGEKLLNRLFLAHHAH
jgi:hypothetical protein